MHWTRLGPNKVRFFTPHAPGLGWQDVDIPKHGGMVDIPGVGRIGTYGGSLPQPPPPAIKPAPKFKTPPKTKPPGWKKKWDDKMNPVPKGWRNLIN